MDTQTGTSIQWTKIWGGNDWSSDATRCMKLNALCYVREASHKRPHIVCLFFYEVSRTSIYMKMESRLVAGRIEEKWGVTAKWVQGFCGGLWGPGSDENALKWIVVMATQLWAENHWIVHCRWVNYIECEIHFNKIALWKGLRGNHLKIFYKSNS